MPMYLYYALCCRLSTILVRIQMLQSNQTKLSWSYLEYGAVELGVDMAICECVHAGMRLG
jgi:hypothetical protein